MAADEWENDPNVLFLRRVFAAIERRQTELLGLLNVHWMDGGLRTARTMALRLFERTWAGRAKKGVRLGEEEAALLYAHCLVKVLHTRGISVPDGFLPGGDAIARLIEEAG